MAPEVMLGKDVDEKSDVYSFGVVLWEIITGQELWPDMTSYPQFKEAIAKRGDRPPIPPTVHPSLKNLLEICWQKDATKRPSFLEILTIIDSVFIDCLISDEAANKFWKDNFLGQPYVEWRTFLQKFAELLKLDIAGGQNKESIISNIMKLTTKKPNVGIECLKKLVAEPNPLPTANANDPYLVSVEKFAQVINWFGPLEVNHKNYSIVDKMEAVMEKEWFFGDISKERAEELLAAEAKGTFLVRASITQPDKPFTISKVSKKRKNQSSKNFERKRWNINCEYRLSRWKRKERNSI